MDKNRIEWIDLCKCIGIIAMIWGHAGISELGDKYIHAWHMPIFFIISGWLFNVKSDLSIKKYVLKKSKAFLIPYFCFGLINSIYILEYYGKGESISSVRSLLWINSSGLIVVGALWFLTSIFFVEVTFFFIFKKIREKRLIGFIIILIGLVGYYCSEFTGTRLFWSADISMSGIVFYYLGYFFNIKKDEIVMKRILNPTILETILVVTIGVVLAFFNNSVDMRTLTYGNIILYYLNAIIISIGYIMFSNLIIKFKNIKILRKLLNFALYIGANSIVYLVLNEIIINMFQFILKNFTNDIFGMFGAYKVIIVIAIITLASILINKWLPIVIGKSRKI
ncbi:acyltransferase family protein [uncultured Clostridium sp.]|uniref:acyltransferase family protein n=1 Tax=uncultured Clostridium sp. TaxID=59620 RepID=UPI0028EBF1BB|nr:acyltransferase family protein [uncultured Clostridium sp.]